MSALTRALDTLLNLPEPEPRVVTYTVEDMLMTLGNLGEVSVIRTKAGGWYAWLEIYNGPAMLKVKSDYDMTSVMSAVTDLYTKAHNTLRFSP